MKLKLGPVIAVPMLLAAVGTAPSTAYAVDVNSPQAGVVLTLGAGTARTIQSEVSEDAPLDITGDAAFSDERRRLFELLASVDESIGGYLWDSKTATLTVQVVSEVALERAREIIASSGTRLDVEFVRVEFTKSELEQLSDYLFANQLEWAGVVGVGGGYNPVLNRVILQVNAEYKDADQLVDAIERLDDPRIIMQVFEPVEGWSPESSRYADYAPWSAGIEIYGTIYGSTWGCTSGWNYQRASTGQRYGSTAAHCSPYDWYHNGTYWIGTPSVSNWSVDNKLLSGSTYAPTVYVTDTDWRFVTEIETSWTYGGLVAMSGATTGLTVSSVYLPTYTLPACAPTSYYGMSGVLMQQHYTDHGDSGGPWLTTQGGTGYVVAHGQHYGPGCAPGYTGSFFVKVTDIQSAQGVNLVTY